MLLVMCERSQVMTKAFRDVGVEAYSVDLLPSYGDLPQYHFIGDCFDVFNRLHPDMVISHPPCTYLSYAGNRYFNDNNDRWMARMDAIGFFYRCFYLPCNFVCVENPVGIMNRIFRKPDVVFHPWQFGDPWNKRTCLWLRGLPNLVLSYQRFDGIDKDFVSHTVFGENRTTSRSHTSPGFARQAALQWKEFALGKVPLSS